MNYFKTPLLSKLDIGEIKYESLQTTLDRLIDDANEAHLLLGDEDSTLENLEFDKEKIISELKLDNINVLHLFMILALRIEPLMR